MGNRVWWLFLMAWRDSRRNRGRLFLFISSIVLGIAALVSTLSFGNNLRDDVEDQAKELVGADLVIRGRNAISDSVRAMKVFAGARRGEIDGVDGSFSPESVEQACATDRD
jgi:putative ABC transport system permease protein